MRVMYAVIDIKGRQYKVSEKEEVLVDRISAKELMPKILLVADEKKVSVGTPEVKGAKVKIKILKDIEMGKKVRVLKYKAKSRYRRHIGTRPQYTRILIEKISLER